MSNWTCRFCGHAQVITGPKFNAGDIDLEIRGLAEGLVGLSWNAIGCANLECARLSLSLSLHQRSISKSGYSFKINNSILENWTLLPESIAKPQPDFIPIPIIEDYVEACRVRELSPKASATLSRRCLQGMIRDFCGISKSTLLQEITELRRLVDEGNAPRGVNIEAVDAIDHVRSVGNIGAHMEKDINLIIPVEAGEAQALIELIELLFDEWYIARNHREVRLARIAQVSADKKQAIANGRAGQNALPPPLLNPPDKAPE